MQRLKVMILAAMAVFALGATMAASAYAGVEALNSEGKPATASFKGTSEKETKLSTLASALEVKCKKTVSEGTLETGGKLGAFHIKFEGCSTSLGGECTGLGDTAGIILALGTQHLATNAALTVGYIVFLTEHLHFSCTVAGLTKLVLVLGQYVCEVKPINVLTAKLTIVCKTNGTRGDPQVTEYLNDKGETVKITGPTELLSSEGDTTEGMAAEQGEGEVTVTPEVKLDV